MNIGITGGIGSGKTTVCKLFEILDIPVYYADARAKLLMSENSELRNQIAQLFGSESYLPSGELNRTLIAEAVYADKRKLQQLNALVHPAVALDSQSWQEQQSSPYTLKEAALLYESGSAKQLDAIIEVYAPEYLRIQRVQERDGISAADIRVRMNNQWPEWKKIIAADYVILNYGNHALIPQVMRIHKLLVKKTT